MRRSTVLAWLVLAVACGSESPAAVETEEVPEPEVAPEAAAWLESEAIPFDGTSLTLPLDDLEPLRDLVGDARVVALGENTHGTRDFFEMKARVLRYLVEEMDFDAFAIEATWPESNRLDRYVRTGNGDSETLLAGLYFWTWRTESVLEMIEWMRDHNAAGGDLGFYGFDMQYPGMALWNVDRYVERVDPERLAEVREGLSCLASHANDHHGLFPTQRYADQPTAFRDSCHASLMGVEAALADREEQYVTASTQDEYDRVARSVRVAIQYEEMSSLRTSRDASMADNAIWLTERLGPESRVVLWAHNLHVSNRQGWMGADLRAHYGDDLLIVGFSHTAGGFTGVTQRGGVFQGLDRHDLHPRIALSYEHHFSAAGSPRFILDLRDRSRTDQETAWLAGPRLFRSIGCCYDPGRAGQYWFRPSLPQEYDVMIHFEVTRATTVLNAGMPSSFGG